MCVYDISRLCSLNNPGTQYRCVKTMKSATSGIFAQSIQSAISMQSMQSTLSRNLCICVKQVAQTMQCRTTAQPMQSIDPCNPCNLSNLIIEI